MAKLIAGLGALLLFGSFGVASAGGDVRAETLDASEPLGGKAGVRAGRAEAAVALATSNSTKPIQVGEMSDEEKERRRDVCVRQFHACESRCWSSKKKGSEFTICREACVRTLSSCMKAIPY
ncbi:MAG TPA: hypothetical protein VEX38_03490 [Fimbriimonadaceae bacterium]|jgi:hypothetical protein|nr:hypothetical protein [Fimbriimonadaceae bacterium]